MSIDINIHISADGAFVQALSDIAGSLAAVSIAKTGNTQVTLPVQEEKSAKKQESVPPIGKPATPKEEKAINDILSTPAPSDPKPSPDEVIDKKLHVGLRKAVGAYCKRLGDNEESKKGHDAVRNWLQERHLQGLSSLTYKDMDDFLEFLGEATKEEVKESA